MIPAGEWERLLREAQWAIENKRPGDFQVDGQAAVLAREMGIPLESVRCIVLGRAFSRWLDSLTRMHRNR